MEPMTGLKTFEMKDVWLKDDYACNALEKEIAYLTRFDADRLLAGFRETAGLDQKGAVRYDGWENSLIGGHTMGHYLSAMAQAYVNPGVAEADREKVFATLKELIDALVECQANTKGKRGYVFGATLTDREHVEQQFDHVERGEANIVTQAWVPWYTMHKLLAGAIEVYELTGYETALSLAKGIGDWCCDRALSWDEATRQTVLSIEYGGMNDALYELYAVTGDETYAVGAHVFDEDALFEKVASGERDTLNDKHANTTIPKFLGALNRYATVHEKTIRGAQTDASAYLRYAESFWDTVVNRHTYVTGGNSEWEHFGRDGILDAERSNSNNETCNVYNMLKLSRQLFTLTGKKKYIDYYENAYINAILSSQNPDSGMTMYFQPMKSGYQKVYSTPFHSFWCCTGSGMENFTKLNDSIYYHNEESVVIAMYLDSELTWSEKGLRLIQSANLQQSDEVKLEIKPLDGRAVSVKLVLRIPDWVRDAAEITVSLDDKTKESAEVRRFEAYLVIDGTFADGAQITVRFPRHITVYRLPDEETVLAFKYGPYVLSADLGTEDEEEATTGVDVTIPINCRPDSDTIALPAGVDREEFTAHIERYLRRIEGANPLAFSLEGSELKFGLHYLRHKERYGIYFYYRTPEEIAADKAGEETADEVVDTVQPGYGQYENDALHTMEDGGSTGVTNDGTYRFAHAGGSFAYRMAVRKGADNVLSLSLRAQDNGKTLEIRAGSGSRQQVLFSETLSYAGTEATYELRVPIPEDIVSAAERVTANGVDCDAVTITFSGADGAESARVCSFIYMLSSVN